VAGSIFPEKPLQPVILITYLPGTALTVLTGDRCRSTGIYAPERSPWQRTVLPFREISLPAASSRSRPDPVTAANARSIKLLDVDWSVFQVRFLLTLIFRAGGVAARRQGE
jgi:hypothetical protein